MYLLLSSNSPIVTTIFIIDVNSIPSARGQKGFSHEDCEIIETVQDGLQLGGSPTHQEVVLWQASVAPGRALLLRRLRRSKYVCTRDLPTSRTSTVTVSGSSYTALFFAH